jgi:hypothetical protein
MAQSIVSCDAGASQASQREDNDSWKSTQHKFLKRFEVLMKFPSGGTLV